MLPPLDLNRTSTKPRALLDTNVWRYVLNEGLASDLRQCAKTGSYQVQISPAVVYETLRIGDRGIRASLIRLMTNRCFQRLMPEAYSESVEILREIERIRPRWLRENPNLVFFERLRNDWRRKTGGFWVRCERDPDAEARRLELTGDQVNLDRAREQAKNSRTEMRDSEWKRNPPMSKTLMGFRAPVPGWRGDMVDAWRIDSLTSLAFAYRERGNGYRDWVAPFVDVDGDLLESADWNEFWLYDAPAASMPRQWLRWAHAFSQRFRKVTPGTPADTQLFTYFLETDVVISADKALLDTLDECRPHAPCALPRGKLITADRAGVQAALELLQTSP